MMEHAHLVHEIQQVEKMTTAERLKHARKRRNQQLKTFWNYEKNLDKESKKRKTGGSSKAGGTGSKKARVHRIQFVSNVMLLEAAARNDIEEVRYLLMEGVSPDVTNEDGLTALHQCCIDDLESMMKLLIEFGANVNARDSELWTPLHAAATCGHVQLCKILVENGATLLSVNADGNMPYDICEDEHTLDYIESEMAKKGVTQELIDDTRLSAEKTFLEDMQLLASTGGDLEFRGRNGETPLHIASANGYLQVIEFLLDHHVAVNSLDDDQWQPIHCAACWGQVAVLEILCQNGALLDAKTRNGETPLDICEDADIKQRLLEMKDEMESHRNTQTKDLKRKRSQNTRSASVRRTSMREKSAISWKEAREEAQRLRESAGSTDDSDEDKSSQLPPAQDSGTVPTSNIDDVQVSVDDASCGPLDSDTGETSTDHAPGARSKTLATTQPAAMPPALKSTKTTHAPQPPPAIIVTNKNGVSSDNNMNKVTGATADGEAMGMAGAGAGHSVNNAEGKTLNLPSSGHSQTSVSSNASSSGKPATESTTQRGPVLQVTPTDSRKSSISSQGFPAGTLSDLKKQRSQKVQDNMKQHTQSWSDQSSSEASNGHTSRENTQPKVNGLSANRARGPDPPMHKYTSPQMEVVGTADNHDGCCVIL